MNNLKEHFLLDPEVVFFNHGSFGATPKPVFEEYQAWQGRLERQPVKFLGREAKDLFRQARQPLANYLHVDEEDVVYVFNTTFGVNVVARSLNLGPEDEVLSTDHEYGACDRTWRFLSQKHGFRYVKQRVEVPLTTAEDIVEQFWQGVTPRTKVIFMSHITSETAVIMPVEAICQRAREAGILTVIDGAHAPGQLSLDLPAIGADFYTGNCHKWLCSPKGSGFLYARREVQHLLEPLVVSWGYENRTPSGSQFIDYNDWLGTNDPSAFLATPAAIQFQEEHNWTAVRAQCHDLLKQTLHRIADLTGCPSIYHGNTGFFNQLAVATLPYMEDPLGFKTRLYDEFKIEIVCLNWQTWTLLRISMQGYNSQADADALLSALEQLL